MALFGAPISHEDDPERAVRAALAIRDWAVAQGAALQLRVAVNTGEVLVALDARSSQGEGMASGDVVNTTARLQTAAPVNGILVGETTYRATSQVITYRAAEPVPAKGKAQPVPVWEALDARSRYRVDLSASRMPLVGRNHELGMLSVALARVRRDRSPQLVTVVGVPGIGKSRLVAELLTADENTDEASLWRQGRSLPYGEGITFWALAEMVKAQAGILETDAADQAEEKLQACLTAVIRERSDVDWMAGHLRPLLGLGSDAAVRGDRREEAFTAWRRFFEELAGAQPLTLVFEDLHWADDSLLDFIEHLLDSAAAVAMLVVCTARPELLERRDGWAGGTRRGITLALAPLSDVETAQLISNLSGRPVMAAETQQALLTRAAGNPLYAEQYVRMLRERTGAEDLPLPETVQGIIAARLDSLPAEEKSLLHAASVMGKVFWLGAAVQTIGVDRGTVQLSMHALERKEFVQRARRSTVADEVEYAFLHVLVRDVAYGQIPRSRRAAQHLVAAEWIASLGRTEDHAEMLAHHYLSAIELLRAAAQAVDPAIADRALESLRAAGDRALSLNAYTGAAGYYQSALALALAGSPQRAHILFQLGRVRHIAGDVEPELLTAACGELVNCGDYETAAEAEAVLAELYWVRGDSDTCAEHLSRAGELVEGREPSPAKAHVLSAVSRSLLLSSEYGGAIRLGREVMDMADRFGLDELRAHALINTGLSRWHMGDPAGIQDLERGAATAAAANIPTALCRAQLNTMVVLYERGHLERAFAVLDEAAEVASRFGLAGESRWIRGQRLELHYRLGRWDEALVGADEFIAEVEAGSPHYGAAQTYSTRAQVRLGRDDVPGALADAERALELARVTKDPQVVFGMLADCAEILCECGWTERASALADECLARLVVERSMALADTRVPVDVLARTLVALGRGLELIELLPDSDTPGIRVAAAFAAGRLEAAVDIHAERGAATEEARDRLWLSEALMKTNRPAEADVHLRRAFAFYRSVRATRYIRACEALFAASAGRQPQTSALPADKDAKRSDKT